MLPTSEFYLQTLHKEVESIVWAVSRERMTMETVWIYTDGESVKVFATEEAAQAWADSQEGSGFAYEYPVEGQRFYKPTSVGMH